ncbi:hypothetical protein JDV02_001010 [Purpureocillium takamizusanense]|uniref:Uncharacterized protein n=1 Tax=Purpureocillium takamizusanense TaxID=2060973 RepID=A0A9Q8V7F1_9HYPO|nr:uncharacterized protein JDV02_001010 [Purpureocillium takamizusanense]UNI14376.1 hypothetical protein JDV02_001010 [Purpureocillium takamizusanense]
MTALPPPPSYPFTEQAAHDEKQYGPPVMPPPALFAAGPPVVVVVAGAAARAGCCVSSAPHSTSSCIADRQAVRVSEPADAWKAKPTNQQPPAGLPRVCPVSTTACAISQAMHGCMAHRHRARDGGGNGSTRGSNE